MKFYQGLTGGARSSLLPGSSDGKLAAASGATHPPSGVTVQPASGARLASSGAGEKWPEGAVSPTTTLS
jgi:hypothetical protein